MVLTNKAISNLTICGEVLGVEHFAGGFLEGELPVGFGTLRKDPLLEPLARSGIHGVFEGMVELASGHFTKDVVLVIDGCAGEVKLGAPVGLVAFGDTQSEIIKWKVFLIFQMVIFLQCFLLSVTNHGR